MSRISKILIFIFLTLTISVSFAISHFSNAQNSENNVSATEISSPVISLQNSTSFTEGTVYICSGATSLVEINPRCPGKIILQLGETIEGLTLTTANYEGKDYYLVLGFTNGGGGVNLPPMADANGPYQCYGGLPITFDASSSTDPNNDPLQYRWDFNNDNIWDTDWLVASTTNHIWNNDYGGIIKLEASDGEFTANSTSSVKVIGPNVFKQDAIKELEKAKTGDKTIDRKISQIIKHIQNSLDNDLWLDSSHLVFFKKDCSDPEILKFDANKIDLEKMFDLEPDKMELKMKGIFKGKCFGPKIGIRVFHEEYIATKLVLTELKGKPRIPEELKNTLEEIITKLVKSDQLLAKVSLYDAKNTPIQNPKFQKIVEYQIKLAEEELTKAENELSKNWPDKAISRFAKSWLHSQLAIKFANLLLKEQKS